VTGALVGLQRRRAPGPRAGVVAAGVRAVVTPTPVTPPVVRPEVQAPEVRAPVATPEAQEAPVGVPTKVGRRGTRETVRVVGAVDAAVAVVATPAGARTMLQINAWPYAMVSVDEGATVRTPHDFVVSPGEHQVRARFVTIGNVEVTRTVTLEAGETRGLGLTPP